MKKVVLISMLILVGSALLWYGLHFTNTKKEAPALPATVEVPQEIPTGNSTTTTVATDTPMLPQTHTEAPMPKADPNARAITYIAGGCFWCTESDTEKIQGVLEAVSGYAGGTNANPTYQNYAEFGHRELVEVTYNPTVVSFKQIVISAIKHMDPTDSSGSFNDRGPQYSPALYYASDEEKKIIEAVVRTIDSLHIYEKPIALQILPTPTFWKAEDFHQNYYKGTLTQLKYKYYRNASGRDAFIEKHWGTDTGTDLPVAKTTFDVSAWKDFVKPSDDELRKKLTSLQYEVTQNHATEEPFNNTYWDNHEEGIYVDVVSGEPLFSSKDKFNSGTGWPSFTKPLYPEAVTEYSDYKLVVPRTEIRSTFAGSHLGHKFNDAPKELGGIRYCMDSAALLFIPKADMEAKGYGQFSTLFN